MDNFILKILSAETGSKKEAKEVLKAVKSIFIAPPKEVAKSSKYDKFEIK